MLVDINTVTEFIVTAAWVVPLVTGLVQVIKNSFYIDPRWVPATSLLIGVAMGLLVIGFTPTAAIVGIIFGLTSSGLYDVGKKTISG